MSRDGDTGGRDWGSLAVSLGVLLIGVGALGAVLYVNVTADLTRADYREFSRNCEDLEGQTRLVHVGLGVKEEQLNRSAVQACRNMTFADYRRARTSSMRTTPFSVTQWAFYGGVGAVFAVIGAVLVRQQLGIRRG